MLLEGVENNGRVGTDDLVDLVAVLEEGEGGHGADAELLGKLGKLVDVELGQVDLVLELLALGPPGCTAVSIVYLCNLSGGRGVMTYLAIWGAMALQGPHQVAKASMMTTSCLAMVSLNWEALWEGEPSAKL